MKELWLQLVVTLITMSFVLWRKVYNIIGMAAFGHGCRLFVSVCYIYFRSSELKINCQRAVD